MSYSYIFDVDALKKAKISIKDVKLHESTLTFSTIFVKIGLSNPIGRSLRIESGDLDAFIENNYIGSSNFYNLSIQPNQVVFINISFKIYHANVALAILESIINNNFEIFIKGKINVKIFFNFITLSQDIKSQLYPN